MKLNYRLLSLCLAGSLQVSVPALGEDALAATSALIEVEAQKMDRTAALQGEARVQQRIAADFATWAGSVKNANALVAGLRDGRTITLTGSRGGSTGLTDTTSATGATSAPPPSGATFTPPTRPMGYGNVFITLALAKAQLAAQGIAAPSPQQIQAMLNGGVVASGIPPRTAEPMGILEMRSGGMGWGAIARAHDLKLGPVIAGMKSSQHSLGVTGQSATLSSTATSASTSTPVSGGESARVSRDLSVQGNASGRGIVTAAGVPATQVSNGSGRAHGNANVGNRVDGSVGRNVHGISDRGQVQAPSNGLAKGQFK